jgi:hypothetical protein
MHSLRAEPANHALVTLEDDEGNPAVAEGGDDGRAHVSVAAHDGVPMQSVRGSSGEATMDGESGPWPVSLQPGRDGPGRTIHSGDRTMLSAVPASIRLKTVGVTARRPLPSVARMKENSPAWASNAPVNSAVRTEKRNRRASRADSAPFARMMRASVRSTRTRWSSTKCGVTSMPTETKKSAAKMSRKGRIAPRIGWESSGSPATMPAKGAQRQGQADEGRRLGHAQRDGGHQQEEEFAVVLGGHPLEQPGQDPHAYHPSAMMTPSVYSACWESAMTTIVERQPPVHQPGDLFPPATRRHVLPRPQAAVAPRAQLCYIL